MAKPSIKQLKQQVEAGEGTSACKLGDRYREGIGVPQDSAAALQWYRRGAEIGDPEAQNNLGSMLLNGIACQSDAVQATYWFRKSAEQGNAVSQWNLAKRYLHGDGIDQNYAEAYKLFGKALLQGYTDAACEMGTMQWLGHGVGRNLLAAADFHLIAAEAGDSVACRNISEYRQELQNLALSGSQRASLFLCRIYNRGFGVEKSQSLTWTWILCAHKHCLPDSDADIAQEVTQTYDFYRQSITPANRNAGKEALGALRTADARKSPTQDRATLLREVVLEVGAEGGSLTLLRGRNKSKGWRFWIDRDERALYDLLSKEDRSEIANYFASTEYAQSFDEALKLLDKYPWFRLYPVYVHPEFVNAVLFEVGNRGGAEETTRWRDQLRRSEETSAPDRQR
jgi:TPR repeat protein